MKLVTDKDGNYVVHTVHTVKDKLGRPINLLRKKWVDRSKYNPRDEDIKHAKARSESTVE